MPDFGTRDLIVIGGGLVGLAAAYGAAREGADVLVFDAGDGAFRASRGNFGLVWAQSKGALGADYAVWTRRAIAAWRDFETELSELTGIDIHYRNGLGLHLCLGEAEVEKRAKLIGKVAAYNLPGCDVRMIGRDEAAEILPAIGPEVTGASISSLDGDCHSLALYRALGVGFQKRGGTLVSDAAASAITPEADGYRVTAGTHSASAPRVLIAAGLAANDLTAPFGFPAAVIPQKGQILVTERLAPFLPMATTNTRQLPEGTVLFGDTKEDAGYDDRSTTTGIAELAARAVRLFPALKRARVVRSWAALRVLTPDGDPIYDQSPTHPGIYMATTHSGVTLAPAHSGPLAQWLLNGQTPPEFRSFGAARFQKNPGANA